MRCLKVGLACVAAMIFASCGGGGNPGSNTSAGTTTSTSTVSNFYIYSDKSSVNNAGSDVATLTVVAVNSGNNVVSGSTVTVSADKNSVFTPTSGAVTSTTGVYTGTIGIGSDKSDRSITVSVTVGGITKQTVVNVTGSKLTLQFTPSAPTPGQSVVVAATLVDYAGIPIVGSTVTLGGGISSLQGQVLTTNSSGVGTKSFTAPAVAGSYTTTASGGGVSAADYQLQVFSGAIPTATIISGAVPSLSASPNVLSVNSAGSSTNKSTLRFLFLDSTNSPIPYVRVRFDDQTTGLPSVGASISSGASTLYTDTSGVVTAQYIPGQNSSPTNGVAVRACYSATDFSSTTDCPASVSVTLTVAGQALAISIGNDNLLEKGSGTYIKTFTVTVADSAGRAVAGASVDISVDLTHYGKGLYAYSYKDSSGVATSNWLGLVPSSLLASYPSDTTVPSASPQRVWCANEDTNRNGSVDAGENVNGSVDSNGQALLEPRKSDLLVRYADPAVTTTNSSGILLIKVEYSQRMATWLSYRVRATTNVAGSQGLAERLFLTTFVDGDDTNGSFLTPPYGSGSCRSAG